MDGDKYAALGADRRAVGTRNDWVVFVQGE